MTTWAGLPTYQLSSNSEGLCAKLWWTNMELPIIYLATNKYSIDILNWIFTQTKLLWSQGYRRVFIISQTKLTITYIWHIHRNDYSSACMVDKIAPTNMLFLSTVVWYNKPNRSKNHTSSPFIISFLQNGKPFFSPEILIFITSISIYDQILHQFWIWTLNVFTLALE